MADVIDVRRAAERFTSTVEGITTRHSFSFGRFYDPANVSHGPLVAHNDEVLAPGHGYDAHPHADLEIVTWVLEGSLVHEDSEGRSGLVRPGVVQVLGAGRGVRHSERNDAPGTSGAAVPTRFVQAWLRPDEPGLDPAYARRDVGPGLARDTLVPLASGIPALDAGVRVRTRGAALHVARLSAGGAVEVPDAPRVHVFVARGRVDLEDAGPLGPGDAARLTTEGGRRLTGLDAAEPATENGTAEVLVWQLP